MLGDGQHDSREIEEMRRGDERVSERDEEVREGDKEAREIVRWAIKERRMSDQGMERDGREDGRGMI